ncbi:uncharacterized protein B0J16DRAFT_393598 [Fusarium flagelliforme]|uniref:uncharacterized protein n=1 Tax=Fusarium flagelliforme TaxID=2675880 RepID=UPI001E8D751C|nr:uncharacterized protein B0J16DRAFT_393598 [Fusarium flagelliforme]KAH7168155.1 hypothetical protein B0J16DRAFT_393598 [Fusarium flagelliforme]
MLQSRVSVATSCRQLAGSRPNSRAGTRTKTGQMPRGPLNICITAQPSLLLSKSIHVRVPIRVGEKIKQVPIYQIPHTVLAHQRPRTVYMFFPRLYDEKCRKKGPVPLREEQNRLFFDGFIRPSIEKIGPQFVHHLPGSYDSVRAASRIAMESSGSAAVRGAAFEGGTNRAERDIAADGSVRETEDASRLWQFVDAIFLCSYKDTKLWHQSYGSSHRGGAGNFRARCGVVSLEQEPTANTGSGNPPYEDDRTEPTPWRQTQLVDVASELLPTRSGHTVLARRCCQYNTLRFLYGQSEEALLGRTALRVEGEADNDWDNEASSSQEMRKGRVNMTLTKTDRRAPRERGSEEEQTAGEGWKPPRIPRAVTTEYPVHMLRDSISITSEPRRTRGELQRGLPSGLLTPNIFNLAHSDEAWAAVARKGNIKASRQDAERHYRSQYSAWLATSRTRHGGTAGGCGRRRRLGGNIDKHLRLMDYIMSYWARDPSTPQILSAPLVVGARSKIGLDMARSREQRGFAFFPKDVVDWHELRLHDWATDLLQGATARHQGTLARRGIAAAVQTPYRPGDQPRRQQGHPHARAGRGGIGIPGSFPGEGQKERVPDMDVFEFTLAGVRADDISRGHLESQHFRVEAKRAIKAFEQLSRSPFITAQRFLCVLYYCFCQQVLCFPNPDKINGVMSVTAKNGSRTDPDTHPQQSAYLSNIIYSIKQIRRYLHLPLSEYDL